MSISNVSSATNVVGQTPSSNQITPARQLRQDFDALSQALSSGDLKAAQSAFSTFKQDLQTVQQSQGNQPAAQSGSSTALDALNSVGQALGSGDLAGAKSAFANLLQDIQGKVAGGGSHHHHHHGQAPAAGTSAATTTVPASTASSSVNTTA